MGKRSDAYKLACACVLAVLWLCVLAVALEDCQRRGGVLVLAVWPPLACIRGGMG